MQVTGYRLQASVDTSTITNRPPRTVLLLVPTQYLTTSTPPATIRATPSAFRTLKLASAPKMPSASSRRLTRSWVAITSERARPTPPSAAATAMEPTITAPRMPEVTAYPTARPVKSGLARTSEITSASVPVVRPENATITGGPKIRWAAPVRLDWTATHTPASTARMIVDFIKPPENHGFVGHPERPFRHSGRGVRRIIAARYDGFSGIGAGYTLEYSFCEPQLATH